MNQTQAQSHSSSWPLSLCRGSSHVPPEPPMDSVSHRLPAPGSPPVAATLPAEEAPGDFSGIQAI